MRTTQVTYTCDRCKEKTPETKTGYYPREWHRLTLFSISSNMNIIEHFELCSKCSKELQKWTNPKELLEEPKNVLTGENLR